MVAGSFWRYPTNMDASATTASISGDTHWISNQPPLSGFSGMYPSEAQQRMLPSSAYSLHGELARLQFSNPVQQGPTVSSHATDMDTASKSKPVVASAEWARNLASENVPKVTEPAAPIPEIQAYTPHRTNPPPEVAYDSSSGDESWQYSSGGETVPTFTLEAEVEEFPYQNTPTQWVSAKPEDGDAGHLVVKQKYTRSSSPQTAFSQKRQRKLYKFVSERPEKEKRSREKRSTACDECSRCKVKARFTAVAVSVVTKGIITVPGTRGAAWTREAISGSNIVVRFRLEGVATVVG